MSSQSSSQIFQESIKAGGGYRNRHSTESSSALLPSPVRCSNSISILYLIDLRALTYHSFKYTAMPSLTLSYIQTVLVVICISLPVVFISASVDRTTTFNPNWQGIDVEFKSWLDNVKMRVQQQAGYRNSYFGIPTTSRRIIVDWHGNGSFTSIQRAIDSIPRGNTQRVIVQINAGTYKEKVTIPKSKPFVSLQGQGKSNTFIVWNDTASDVNSTYRSASVAVNSMYFSAANITFKNSAPAQQPGAVKKQAVAFRISGDQAAFYGCGFQAHQDTLYDHRGKHYFEDCYIEGSIDFIFGNGQSLYKNCELKVVPVTIGALTAQKRAQPDSNTGFSFVNCSIMGSGIVYLGRAWGTYSRVVYSYTYMADIIIPEGWYNWGDPNRTETVYYGQYKCTGPAAIQNGRVPWAHELTDAEAQPFLSMGFIDGAAWVPQTKIT